MAKAKKKKRPFPDFFKKRKTAHGPSKEDLAEVAAGKGSAKDKAEAARAAFKKKRKKRTTGKTGRSKKPTGKTKRRR